MVAWALLVQALALAPGTASDGPGATCPAGKSADGAGCLAAASNTTSVVVPDQDAGCAERGFDPKRLSCGTCRALGQRLEEAGGIGLSIVEECLGCCREAAKVERFSLARLIADASQQDRDQDLHDFIKRKAPLFPALEVEYQEGASPALELENEDAPDRVVRADVSGWKSDHLAEFLKERLHTRTTSDAEGSVKMVAAGAWTAEVQSCSG